MKRTVFLLAVGLFLCGGTARALHFVANAQSPSSSALPQLQYLHRYDAEKETLQLDEIREVTEATIVRETDPASGRVIHSPKEDTHQIIERRTCRLADIQAVSPQGDTLKLTEVMAKLKPEQPVLVMPKGMKLPAGYQKLFREDVVVLQLPVSNRPPAAFGPVAPVPAIFPPRAGPVFVPADARPGFAAPPALPFAPPVPASEEVPRF